MTITNQLGGLDYPIDIQSQLNNKLDRIDGTAVNLHLSTDPTDNMGAVTKRYVDDAVVMEWGTIVGDILDQVDLQTSLSLKQNTLTFDTTPTDGSTNPVESNGVFDALALKLTASSNLSDVASQQTALNNVTNAAGATDEFVLTKDTATGNAIFKASAGGGGYWTQGTGVLYPTTLTDKVAIGATTADYALHIKGGSYITSTIAQRRSSNDGFGGYQWFEKSRGTLASPADVVAGDLLGGPLFYYYNSSWKQGGGFQGVMETATTFGIGLFTAPFASWTSNKMYLSSAGNLSLGLGGTLPTARLHIKSSNSTLATFSLKAENSIGTSLLCVRNDGNVGIGIDSPQDLLHVKGGVRIQRTDGTQVFQYNNTANVLDFNVDQTSLEYRMRGTTKSYLFTVRREGVGVGLDAVNDGDTTRLLVKGVGNTSATYAQKIENSSGTSLLSVRDDELIQAGNTNASFYINSTGAAQGVYYHPTNGMIIGNYTGSAWPGAGKLSVSGISGLSSLDIGSVSIAPTYSGVLNVFGTGKIEYASNKGLYVSNANGIILGSYTASTWAGEYGLNINGNLWVGAPAGTASTRAYIKGAGSTSATFAQKIENSSGTSLSSVRDDGLNTVHTLQVTNNWGFGVTPTATQTGWTTSNVTNDRIIDANATSIDELADVLATLIEDLKTKGVLSA